MRGHEGCVEVVVSIYFLYMFFESLAIVIVGHTFVLSASAPHSALADQCALWRQPVEGKTVPGREQMRLDLRSQPRQPVPHRHHPRIVPGHIDKARAAAKPA